MNKYLEVTNDSGKLAISNIFNSWKLKSVTTLAEYRVTSYSGSGYTFYHSGGTESIPSNSYGYVIPSTATDICVLANNSTSDVYVYGDYVNSTVNGVLWKGLFIGVLSPSASLADSLKILTFENTKATDAGNCGLNIFDANHQLLFSSNERSLRPIATHWVDYVSSPQFYYYEGDALQDALHDSRNRYTIEISGVVPGFIFGRCCSSKCFVDHSMHHMNVAIAAKINKNHIVTGEITMPVGQGDMGWNLFEWGEQSNFSVVDVTNYF